jgi:hypothetical protein
MTCFEISVNGEKVFTAGVPDGVLSFDAHWLGPVKDRPGGMVHWSLGGLTEDRGFREHVWWTTLRELSEGDVVTVKVVSSDHPDEPTKRERAKDD